MKKLKLLLDVDEVICFSGFLQLVNEFLGTEYSIDDFKSYYIEEEAIPKERMNEFIVFCRDKDQYANPQFLPGAIDAVMRLSEYYDIYLCSDCRNPFDLENSGRIFMSKFNFLFRTIPQDVIPAKNYILTGTKNIFKADVQVDDLLKNLDSEIELKILFPSYHNKNITEQELFDNNILRAGNDWRIGWAVLEGQLIQYAMSKQSHILNKKQK